MYEFELMDLEGNIVTTGSCKDVAKYAGVEINSLYKFAKKNHVIHKKYRVTQIRIDRIPPKDPIWEEFDRITYEMKMLFKKLMELRERKTT